MTLNESLRRQGPDVDSASPTMGTVTRVIQILRQVAEADDETTAGAVAENLGLPLSTTHRLLGLLTSEGMIARSGRRGYNPGMEFHRLAQIVLERVSIIDVARPRMLDVVAASSESCTLGMYRPATRTMEFVDVVESDHPLIYRVPLYRPEPVYVGSSGKSIMAYLPKEEIVHILEDQFGSSSGFATTSESAKLQESLIEIQKQGYAVTHGEKLAGAVGIASPVFNATDRVIGSLCITIPEIRFDPAQQTELGELVRREAMAVSSGLGSTRV